MITPTYNRGDKLTKLYNSLCQQTCKDFEWLIIDDGSSDKTCDVVSKFQADVGAAFDIRYEYQENGGKHRALNRGIELIDSELTFIVDSDDWLTEDAVKTILEFEEKYASRKEADKLCGFSFLRAFSNGKVNTGEFPVDGAVDTYRQQRINNNLLGDKAEVYYTNILKQFPFEEFEGERFMPEDAVWMKMSGPYNMVHANRIIYYCDYLEGGLTKSGKKMKIHSPYGMMYRSAVYLNDSKVNIKSQLKMAVLYDVYSSFAKGKDNSSKVDKELIRDKRDKCQISSSKGKILILFMSIPSYFIFLMWKGKYSANRGE